METVQLAVNGTLMRGFALNRNLRAVGATFVHEAVTATIYRLWSALHQKSGQYADPLVNKTFLASF